MIGLGLFQCCQMCLILLNSWKTCCNCLGIQVIQLVCYRGWGMTGCQKREKRWEWHLKYVHEARSSHHKICSIEHSLHFTGLDVLSIPNNSTYFQPNVSVTICEKVWEEVRWNCKNPKNSFHILCPWKVWDRQKHLFQFTGLCSMGCWLKHNII